MSEKRGSMNSTVEIRNLTLQDLPAVAEIHLRAFPHSALTHLGLEAVRRYYEWQMVGPHDLVALGAFIDGKMAGFSFAGYFIGSLMGFVRQNKGFLLWHTVTHFWLLNDEQFRARARRGVALLVRLLKGQRATVKVRPSSPSIPQTGNISEYSILSIAVDPNIQGKGIGKLLMAENERRAQQQGYGLIGLNVNHDNAQAIGFYQSIGFEKFISQEGGWHGKMKKPLQPLEVSGGASSQ